MWKACYSLRVNRKWIILQDTREKQPLLFPRTMVMLDAAYPATDKRRTTVSIHVVKKALKTGDYAIQGHEDRCLVERKGSAREIAKNTMHGKDRQRFERELVRLKEETAFPVLLMEGWPSQLLEHTKTTQGRRRMGGPSTDKQGYP